MIVIAVLISYFTIKDRLYNINLVRQETSNAQDTGTQELITREDVKRLNGILLGIPVDNYALMEKTFLQDAVKIQDYITVLGALSEGRTSIRLVKGGYTLKSQEVERILGYYSYTLDEAVEAYGINTRCAAALGYALHARNYAESVRNRAERLLKFNIFDENTQKRIAATGAVYFENNGKAPLAYICAGLEMLMHNPYADIFALLAAIVCGVLAFFPRRDNKDPLGYVRNKDIVYILIFVAGMIILFVSETCIADILFGLGPLDMSVNSATAFKACPYNLEVWEFLLFRILFKIAGTVMAFLLCGVLVRSKHPVIAGTVGIGLTAAVELFILKDTAFDLAHIFRFENVVKSFKSIELLGDVRTYLRVFVIETAVLFLIISLFAGYRMRKLRAIAKTKAEQEYFNDINEKYSRIRMLRHDMKNHLSAALLLLNEGRTEEAREYLSTLADGMADSKPVVKTGVNALDMLIWNKLSQADQTGIKVKMVFRDDYSDTSISAYELCSVYGNLLDNAIEAVSKLEDEDRYIDFKAVRQMDMLCIFCENRYLNVNRENGRFLSTKADPAEHGLGLRQIEHIAKKYNGTVDITAEDGIFSVSVLLQG